MQVESGRGAKLIGNSVLLYGQTSYAEVDKSQMEEGGPVTLRAVGPRGKVYYECSVDFRAPREFRKENVERLAKLKADEERKRIDAANAERERVREREEQERKNREVAEQKRLEEARRRLDQERLERVRYRVTFCYRAHDSTGPNHEVACNVPREGFVGAEPLWMKAGTGHLVYKSAHAGEYGYDEYACELNHEGKVRAFMHDAGYRDPFIGAWMGLREGCSRGLVSPAQGVFWELKCCIIDKKE